MEERLSLKSRKIEPGISGKWFELINAYRIHEESRYAYAVCEFLCKVCSEICSMLTVRRVLYVPDYGIVYLICSGRDVFEKASASANCIEVFEFVSFLGYGSQNCLSSEIWQSELPAF